MMKLQIFPKLICLILLIFTNCSWFENSENLGRKEADLVEKNIDNLLNDLGYKKYKLYVYPHFLSSRALVSKKAETEVFRGSGFTPEGPAGTEPNIPPGYKDIDYQTSQYRKSNVVQNFDEKGSEKISLNHISVLLIFDSLGSKELKRLEGLIEDTILNHRRGDEIRVTRRKDIQNSEKSQ